MRCPSCNAENQRTAKFCVECGIAFQTACAKCGFKNPPTAKFCQECGAGPAPLILAPVPETSPVQSHELTGERRHLTVLFCDLVGSTEIAARLDPEEWRELVAGYHRAAAEAITRLGGHVAKYLGDGVMAFFGWPEAHENDAERAARAGLAILESIAKLNKQPGRPTLSARVGIHSGAVVVGAGAGKETDVFGDAPNVAARVQEAATPGTLVATSDTHRLVTGLFVVESMGAPALKGIRRPIQLYRVVRPSGVRGRLEAVAAARGVTTFVGREDELRQLMNRWQSACEGEGGVALIIGEAGIGKSRLVQHFHEAIAGTPHTWIEAAASPFFQNTPFYPVTEMLKQALAWRGDEPAEEQLTQLGSALELAGLKPDEAIPLVAPLLNLPLPARYPLSALSPEQQRRRLLATLVKLAMETARLQPTVISTEDLHWADPSTLELIQLLVEQGARAPLLLLYTARPEFHPQWPVRAHHTQITLNRLSAGNVRVMVREVAARNALPDETVAAVIERTGGVPLFVEELTRAVLESGGGNLAGREIPATLHDSLMARLDRLGPAKQVIQVGAVIGGEFSYELLRAVHPIAEAELQRALRAVIDAELLYVRGIAPESTYQFKHALIRDAAYQALLKSRRKELHRQVARTISEEFVALGDAQPEVLARHWTEAGETEPAIGQWSKAGGAAQARNAFKEALENYKQARNLLTLLPESPERDSRELELGGAVSTMAYLTKGNVALEIEEINQRNAVLAEKSGNLVQTLISTGARGAAAFGAGDIGTASALADQALELALRLENPSSVLARDLQASLSFVRALQIFTGAARGDLAGVEKHFTAGLKFFDDPDLWPYEGTTVSSFAFASFNAWTLGGADTARARMVRAMTAGERGGPYNLAFSTAWAAQLRMFLLEYEQAEALAGRALQLAEQHQFQMVAALSRGILGHARAYLGRAAEGVALIRQAIASYLEIRMPSAAASLSAPLAAALERDGSVGEALATLEQALESNLDSMTFRPGTLNLCGELRLRQGHPEQAEADFREAISLAQEIGAKAWELRATMSLARLLAEQGRRGEARAMLAVIYGWFTEGFDTADLKDAKALLDDLAAAVAAEAKS